MDMDDGSCVPLPLDHFFFCFLPPVDAAGAYIDNDINILNISGWYG